MKNRGLGNNTIFLQHFFGFGGGEISPFPPGSALAGALQNLMFYSKYLFKTYSLGNLW